MNRQERLTRDIRQSIAYLRHTAEAMQNEAHGCLRSNVAEELSRIAYRIEAAYYLEVYGIKFRPIYGEE